MKIILKNIEFSKSFEDIGLELDKDLMSQISKCNFEIKNDECQVEVMYNGEKARVTFSNEINTRRFLIHLGGVSYYEKSIKLMYEELYVEEWNKCLSGERKVIDMLREYKLKHS
ncbi:hypothetical protein HMPREF9099_03112 [Lachnospiraceae bacterium oral taxon 082 str. F0431]|nr:hypothetical protein HMPREF9099_03112 [Lachnospiraceae bacterium oral taxon 082 str. F0431]